MKDVPVFHQGVQGFLREYDKAIPPSALSQDTENDQEPHNDGLPRIFVLGTDVVLYHGTTRINGHQTKPLTVYEPNSINKVGGQGVYREIPNEEAINQAIVELRQESVALFADPTYPAGMGGTEIDGQSLKVRRDALDWSQAKLATELGTDQNTISRWEKGKMAISNPRMLDLALRQLEASTRKDSVR